MSGLNVGGDSDLAVAENVERQRSLTGRAAIRQPDARITDLQLENAGQVSCDSKTCIANNVLSKHAWKAPLPRFVKRSSPKSNFINL